MLVRIDDPHPLDAVGQVLLNLRLQPDEPIFRRQNLDDEERSEERRVGKECRL